MFSVYLVKPAMQPSPASIQTKPIDPGALYRKGA
jgi:hypothetical protein